MIDQDAAHRPRRGAEEVRPVLPRRLVVRQSQVRLVDEVGRVNRVTAALAAQVTAREPFQLGVDQGGKAGLDVPPAVAQRFEENGDFAAALVREDQIIETSAGGLSRSVDGRLSTVQA